MDLHNAMIQIEEDSLPFENKIWHFLAPYTEKATTAYSNFFNHSQKPVETILEARGNIKGVFAALKNPKPGSTVAIICPGGGQGCALLAGYFLAFEEAGFLKNYIKNKSEENSRTDKKQPTLVGVMASSGWSAFGYWVAGNVKRGAALIIEENCQKQLFNPLRARYPYPFALDVLMDDLWFGPKSWNMDEYFRTGIDMYISVTAQKPQQIQQLDKLPPKKKFDLNKAGKMIKLTRENAFDLIKATMHIPAVYRGDSRIDGVQYFDGSLWNPLPVRWTMEQIKPDYLLVLSGRPINLDMTVPQSDFASLIPVANAIRAPYRTYLKSLTEWNALQLLHEKEVLKRLATANGNIAIISPKQTPITPYAIDPAILQEGIDKSYVFMKSIVTKS